MLNARLSQDDPNRTFVSAAAIPVPTLHHGDGCAIVQAGIVPITRPPAMRRREEVETVAYFGNRAGERMKNLAAHILLIAGMTLTSLIAHAQSSTIQRIGWLSLAGPEDADSSPYFEAFREGLSELGFIEGRNLIIEARWAPGDPDRGIELARELVGLGVAAIVTQGVAIRAARPVAGSIPVVFALSADPQKAKLVDSLARPAGNFTGVTFMSYELNAKRLELLKEVFPGLSRVALLSNPEHAGEDIELEVSRRAAAALGMTVQYLPVRSASDFEPAFAAVTSERAEAIIALPDALMMQLRARVIDFSIKQRIPAVSGWPAFARSGGIFTYGPNLRESFRAVARSAGKILGGAKPADVPVEQPTKFELVVNAKSARDMGVTLPAFLLARADEVIE
jgi:putative ABC transport system substrate-binding protein